MSSNIIHDIAIYNGIALEQVSAEVSEDGSARLYLVIVVANKAYHKEVFCRITFDNWETFHDYYASHQYGAIDDSLDQFICEIPCSVGYPHGEFALACSQDKELFWDNNSWKNFKVDISKPVALEEAVGHEYTLDTLQEIVDEGNVRQEVVEEVECAQQEVVEAAIQNYEDTPNEKMNSENAQNNGGKPRSNRSSNASTISQEKLPQKKKSKASKFLSSLNCASGK